MGYIPAFPLPWLLVFGMNEALLISPTYGIITFQKKEKAWIIHKVDKGKEQLLSISSSCIPNGPSQAQFPNPSWRTVLLTGLALPAPFKWPHGCIFQWLGVFPSSCSFTRFWNWLGGKAYLCSCIWSRKVPTIVILWSALCMAIDSTFQIILDTAALFCITLEFAGIDCEHWQITEIGNCGDW